MTERQKERAFVKDLLRRDESPLGQDLQAQICKSEQNEKCVRCALMIVFVLGLLSVAGLGYSAVLLPSFFENSTLSWSGSLQHWGLPVAFVCSFTSGYGFPTALQPTTCSERSADSCLPPIKLTLITASPPSILSKNWTRRCSVYSHLIPLPAIESCLSPTLPKPLVHFRSSLQLRPAFPQVHLISALYILRVNLKLLKDS